MHNIDLLPTLISLAGAKVTINGTIDGMDLSNMIINQTGILRTDVATINNFDGISSLISDNYKLVNGSMTFDDGSPDAWLGTNTNSQYNNGSYVSTVQNSLVAQTLSKYHGPLSSATILNLRKSVTVTCVGVKTACNAMKSPCLFDIVNDPCEEVNLATTPALSSTYTSMITKFNHYVSTAVPIRNKPSG